MNERIKQFARESHIDVYGLGLDRVKWEATLETFAELIVAKCIAQCEFVAKQAELANVGEVARKTRATADSCAMMIKLHFETNGADT